MLKDDPCSAANMTVYSFKYEKKTQKKSDPYSAANLTV